MEKRHLDRRLAQMEAEGTELRPGVNVGVDITVDELRDEFDALVLAGGATAARDLPVPGSRPRRDPPGHGVPAVVEPGPGRATCASTTCRSRATDKDVIIIGGGDTGADCLGTSHRHGARSVTQLEILPRPVDGRPEANPWPTYPMSYKVTSAHEEGGDRVYAVNTECFLGDDDGQVRALRLHEVELVDGRFVKVEGTDREIPCQLVLLAMGFLGPEREGLLEQLGVELDPRTNVARDDRFATSVDGVFVAGDMGRGQSLIVWAIAEGRSAAAEVDRYLVGDTALPRIIDPTDRPLA